MARSPVVARLGLVRDPNYLYFVRGGDVWRVVRRQSDGKTRRARRVARTGVEPAPGYLYFVDRNGHLARARRPPASSLHSGGKGR